MPERSAAPGAGGYVLAVLVSDVVFGLLLASAALLDGDLPEFLGGWLLVTGFALFYCLPFAVPGVLLIHLLSRPFRSQAAHVAVTGLVGLVAGWVAAAWVFDEAGISWLPVTMALATAAGRAAVVPLVPAVRRPREPVDDDFVGTPPRW